MQVELLQVPETTAMRPRCRVGALALLGACVVAISAPTGRAQGGTDLGTVPAPVAAASLVPATVTTSGEEAKTKETTASPAAQAQTATTPPAPTPAIVPAGATIAGSLTCRANLQEGANNDRIGTRVGFELSAGRFTAGMSAEAGNTRVEGGIHHEQGVGSIDIAERWVAWRSRGRVGFEARAGHAFGLRFGQGLLLGAASFDGLQLIVDPSPRHQVILLAGRTESLDPLDLIDEPLDLFPDRDELGSDGELVGVRGELRPSGGLTLGGNLLSARGDIGPSARLASADVQWSRGIVDVAGELGMRDGGGTAVFLRTDITPAETWGVSLEARRYSDFASPLGSAPLYAGLSAGDARNETGALVRFDVAPSRRFSASYSFDYSRGGAKTGDGGSTGDTVRRDHRVALRWSPAERTAIAYGFELEDVASGRDGTVHSLLVSHAFERGGRLSGRLALDRASDDARKTLRVSYRLPLLQRKLTLLIDDTLRLDDGASNELALGTSFRLGAQSFLTARVTLQGGEDKSIDLSWYRRFGGSLGRKAAAR